MSAEEKTSLLKKPAEEQKDFYFLNKEEEVRLFFHTFPYNCGLIFFFS
jgi:hypothetical protein